MNDVFFEELDNKLPAFFTRAVFCSIVSGLWTPKTIANAESADPNCDNGKKIVGGKALYCKEKYLIWLKSRCS